jgi:hypothetical protein
MKLFQIIANAQGSRTFFNMGQAFGFSDELMAQAVRYFIPPMAKAIERRAQTPEGLLSVLEFLGSRRYGRFLDDARIFGHNQVLKEGERVLGYLFVREERIKRLVENRAQRLPIEPEEIHRLLPYIAVMVIGAIEVRTRRPLGVIWHRITKGAADDRSIANPYLALAEHLKRQEREQRDHRRRRLFSFLGAGTPSVPPSKAPDPAFEAPALFQSA